ncbi:putative integral membrane protein [Candida parapsilosis]|uniref:Intimal thickness related receptor IRP domain-containing protein n=2 Tax=Candida parapsilosis TaxID=5480 RepID=G8BFH7_CANPC|nr:uncharacterized protein CPAR2_202540 [Candida parapsilosis]KAF6055238.1 putative integral membrane protein [Candida parapsilosis]KAF6055739.1 hypothetical protein FOB59_000251 [Candida parapsilosis]KAF6058669.1 putative integral membrane protein [Candida parapsilosis]KAF6067426.1 putative integral membrane protein [Candida parapsilosis]KAI5901335.1 hypothetical protein K4G60_g471 [Candida parapsilosis]
MHITAFSLIAPLLLLTSHVFALRHQPTVLNYTENEVCRYVHTSTNRPNGSYIRLLADESISQYEIFGFIFPPEIILDYHFPNVQKFFELYFTKKPDLYQEMMNKDGLFNVKKSGAHTEDELIFWSGVIDKEVLFPVPVSNIYCVYIVPNSEKKLDFVLPVDFKQHYGNLSYPHYLYFATLKTILTIALSLLATITYYVIIRKDWEAPKKISPVEAIAKTFVFWTLASFIVAFSIDFIQLLIENNFVATYQISQTVLALEPIAVLAKQFYVGLKSYLALLLSMGFGVLYYYNGKSVNYGNIPRNWVYIAFTYLIFDIFTAFIWQLLSNQETISLIGEPTAQPIYENARHLAYLKQFNFLVWFVLAALFYFKTKKRIATTSSKADMTSASNVALAFKRSTLTIWILPLVAKCVVMLTCYLIKVNFIHRLRPVYPPRSKLGPMLELIFDLRQMQSAQKFALLTPICLEAISAFLTASVVFIVWVKSGNRKINHKTQ